MKSARDDLLAKVDELIEPETNDAEPSGAGARDAHDSGELRALWRRVQERQTEFATNDCTQEDLSRSVNDFFAWQRKSDRLSVLMNSGDTQMLQLKWCLLEMLRQDDVFVLERGAIEQYYQDDIVGQDKPSQAEDFCTKCATRDAILACCSDQEFMREGKLVKEPEFNIIFGSIFRDTAK